MTKILTGIIWTILSFFLFVHTSSSSATVLEEVDHQSKIQNAQLLPTFDEKYDYLVAVGEYFIHQKRYFEARKIAEFVLHNLDENSFEAKRILMITKLKGVLDD